MKKHNKRKKEIKKHKKRKEIVEKNANKNCENRIEFCPSKKFDEVSIVPTIKRFFYCPISDIELTGGLTIPSDQFINDDGNRITKFLIFGQKGYVNLYVNGVIQLGGLYVVDKNFLTIMPVNSKILAGTPIIVESLGFLTKWNK